MNYKSVRELSLLTGVSITTIRHFIKLEMLRTTEGRPIKIDIDSLPAEFTCLYDPNYILLEEFQKIYGVDLKMRSTIFMRLQKRNFKGR